MGLTMIRGGGNRGGGDESNGTEGKGGNGGARVIDDDASCLCNGHG